MRKEFVVLGAMLLIGAMLPAVSAHWGSGEGNPKVTEGVAGTTAAVAGPAVVDTGGNVAVGRALITCDFEVAGPGDQWVASDEAEVDENTNPEVPSVPDNVFNDGGSAGACHVSTYALSDFNTEGCGETADHGYANANPVVSPFAPVFVSTGCDLGTTGGGQVNPTGALSTAVCVVNQVLEGTPGEFVPCLDPLTSPTFGFSNCQQDGTADVRNFGYPAKRKAAGDPGVPVPTKTETQNTLGGALDCSGTDGSTAVFVFAAVDLLQQQVSGPAFEVWTTGSR